MEQTLPLQSSIVMRERTETKNRGRRIQERFSVCFLKMGKTQARFQTAGKEQEKRCEKQGGKGVSGRRRGLDVRGLAQGLHESEKLR